MTWFLLDSTFKVGEDQRVHQPLRLCQTIGKLV